MKKINIVCRKSKFGLSKCTSILNQELASLGHIVTVSNPNYDGDIGTYINNLRYSLLLQLPTQGKPANYDINLFVEDLDPSYFSQAESNYFIPNQEWFRYRWLAYLPKVDRVLAKTQLAQQLFTSLKCETAYVGFTSEDCFVPEVPKDYSQFFHLAGNSPYKGTETILRLWEKHPEWPTLVVVQSAKHVRTTSASNIQHHVGYIEDPMLRSYQNRCGVHLCLSETEGFGHYIVEAMSCQALVIATDAPPVNELVTPQRGMLVDFHQAQSHRLSTRYYVDPHALERCIQVVLALSETHKAALGQNARNWYQQNGKNFKAALEKTFKDMSIPVKTSAL